MMEPKYDQNGLVPAICQEARTGEVLMLAWMNRQALQRTRETGQAHFWSRSRQQLWHKGATSGNFLEVCEMRMDCDGDALLLRVRPAGPACHTGARSCFHRPLPLDAAAAAGEDRFGLDELFAVVQSRQNSDPETSYTARLLAAGPDRVLQKVGEEAVEVLLAAAGQGRARVLAEVADLLYHLLVMLAQQGLTLAEVEAELAARHRGAA